MSGTQPTSGPIEITRLTPSSPLISDTISFALSAYRLLFSHLISDPTRIPNDLDPDVFHSTYLSPATPPSPSTSSRSRSGCFLIAHRGSTILGAIAYRPYDRRFPLLPLWSDQRIVEVVRLFVDPSERGQGVAGRLINRLVDEAGKEGVDGMYLHTHPFLPGAQGVWEGKGWEVLRRDEDGVWDSVHMLRWLGGVVDGEREGGEEGVRGE